MEQVIFAAVSATPDPSGLPGSNVLQQIVNGAEAWALAITVLGAFVGAGLWAIASHTNNHHYAARGRMAAVVSAASALVIGAAPGLVNFFEKLGATAR
jgi:Family of unknown function (DUF6112)